MELIERILWKEQPLCYILRAELSPDKPHFPTPPDFKLQVGYIAYPKGHEIPRHVHRRLERKIVGTSEVLIVRKGRCDVDIYNDERELVATRELRLGDVMIMVGGGHAFRMLEDTVFLEVKQGPYPGVEEKERF